MMTTDPDVYVFDAYGALFDVHSAVARHRDAIGPKAALLSEIWRAKQLEYAWVRSLCGAYRDFSVLIAQALDHAAARCCGISISLRERLLDADRNLDAYPDVEPALGKRPPGRGGPAPDASKGTSQLRPIVIARLADRVFPRFIGLGDQGNWRNSKRGVRVEFSDDVPIVWPDPPRC